MGQPIEKMKRMEIELWRVLYRFCPDPVYVNPSRDSDCFAYYTHGGHRFTFADQVITAHADDVVYLPAGSAYTNEVLDENTEYYQVDFKMFQGGEYHPLQTGARIIRPPESDAFLPLVKELYDEFSSAMRSVYTCSGILLRLVGEFHRVESEHLLRQTGVTRIMKSVAYLQEHYSCDTSLDELAQMANTCPSNLEKVFRKCYGTTPIAYRNQLRVNRAKQLLDGGLSIGETAEKVGFADLCYFSRVFKRATGITPGEYIRGGRGN